MSVRISLTLEASEMFLSLHMIFSLERAAVVWAILERISGFDPSFGDDCPKVLEVFHFSSRKGMKLKLCIHFHDISIAINFLLSLPMCFRCCGNLKVSIDL